MVVLLAFLVLLFELSDLLQLSLFLDLEDRLFTSLGKKDIKNWLNLAIVLEKVVVADLSLLVDASLLWHVLR